MNTAFRLLAAIFLNLCLLAQQVSAELHLISFDSAEWVPMQSVSQSPDWLLMSGEAGVSPDGEGFGGGRALKIPSGPADDTRVHRRIDWTETDGLIAFVDFLFRPSAESGGSGQSAVHVNGSQVAFQRNTDGSTGTVWVYSGNDHAATPGEEAEGMRPTAATFPLDPSGNHAASFLRITIRQDYLRNVWDLFVDGKLVAANLDTEGRDGVVSGIDFFNGVDGDTWMDDLQARSANMLFPDADKDGLPDEWETANGTDPNEYDRDLDPSNSGKSALDRYMDSLWTGGGPRINGTLPVSTTTVPALSLPEHTPVGSLKGSFSVGADGAATYSLPIDIPKGAAGMEPQLNLNYSSNGGNGLLGLGWSIGGLQTITRGPASVAKDGAQDPVDFDGNDVFYLDGQRLVCIKGQYGAPDSEYRTEIDSYARITAVGDGPLSWQVETKSGLTMTFGHTPNSRVAETRGFLSWGLSKVADTCGNDYSITYERDAGTGYDLENHRVAEIRYAGRGANGAPCRVVFEYQNRPDKSRGYGGALSRRTSKRLAKVLVFTGTYINHSYRLGYETSDQSGRSLLTTISKHIEDKGDAWKVPSTTFTYDGLKGADAKKLWRDPAGNPLPDYGTNLDASGELNSMACLGADNTEIRLTGDTSRAYRLPAGFTLHPDTWVKFDFKSTKLTTGAIFGVDNNRQYENGVGCAMFRIGGDGSNINMGGSNFSGPSKPYDAPADDWRTYNTSIGHLATGPMAFLVLMCADNKSADGQDTAFFRNIRFYRKNTQIAADVLPITFSLDTELPRYVDGNGKDLGLAWIDLDADGLVDIADWRVVDYSVGSGAPPLLVPKTIGNTYRNVGGEFVMYSGFRPSTDMPLGCRAADAIANDYVTKHLLLAQPVDVDGDGSVELLAAEQARSSAGHIRNLHSFYSFENGTWTKKPAWNLPFRSENIPSSQDRGGHKRFEHFTFADLDSDGYPDLLVHTTQSGRLIDPATETVILGPNSGTVFRNLGKHKGWERDDSVRLPAALMENEGRDVGRRLLDIDGDGRLDLIEASDFNNGTRKWSYLADGGNYRWRTLPNANNPGTPRYALPATLINTNYKSNGVLLADLNGDGLPDVLRRNQGEGSNVWINRAEKGGNAWLAETPPPTNIIQSNNYSLPFPLHYHHDGGKKPYGFEMADLNGDGLVDILYSDVEGDTNRPGPNNTVLLNTGDGWKRCDDWGLPGDHRIYAAIADRSAGKRSCMLQDIDGDGFPDLLTGLLDGNPRVWFNRCRPEVLLTATDGFGSDIQIGYKRLNDPSPVKHGSEVIFGRAYTKGTDLLAGQAALIDSRLVVTTYSEPDGTGGSRRRYQRYGDLRYDRNNDAFLGFGWIEALDQRTGQLTRTDTRRDYPFAGSPDLIRSWVNVEATDLVDTPLTGVTVGKKLLTREKADYAIQTTVFPNGRTARGIVQTFSEKTHWDLTGTIVSQQKTDQVFDEYGFVTSSTVTSSDGATVLTENDYRHVTTNGRWHLGRLTRSTVTKSGAGKPALSRSSAFTYHADTGLLLTETIEPDRPSLTSTKTYEHDAFGNITRTTLTAAGINRSATSTYNATGRFLLSETNALGHTVSYQYDTARALLTATTDANTRTTRFVYDKFGTLIRTDHPDGTRTGEHTGFATNNNLPSTVRDKLNGGIIRYFRAQQSSGSPVALVYFDALGRELATETTILRDARLTGGSRYAKTYTITRYDNLGRKIRISEPFFPGEDPNFTTFTYDLLSRLLTTKYPDGFVDQLVSTTSVTLNGRTHTWSKSLTRGGLALERWDDEHGRMVQSRDSSGLLTTFTHDHDGRLRTATVGGVKLLENTYDILGNKTVVWEANSGTSTSAYNALGEVIRTTNARGQTTTYTYDHLGRVKTTARPEGITYTTDYDPSGNKGLPWRVTGSDGSVETTTYDHLGRPVESSVTRPTISAPTGQTFVTKTTYDALGRVHTSQDAGGLTLVHGYDPLHSFPVQIAIGPDSPGAGTVLWAAGWYDSNGRAREETLANGVTRKAEYHPLTGLTTNLSATHQGALIQAYTTSWDKRGNLDNRSNHLAGRHENFTYDGINRLTGAQVTATAGAANQTLPPNAAYTYATNGNLLAKPGATLAYEGLRPHAVTTATLKGVTHSYAYDAAGFMISDTVGGELRREFAWTSFGQLRRLDYQTAPSLQTLGGIHLHAPGRVETDFQFDSGGNRTRQIKTRIAADDSRDVEETLYLGAYERETHGRQATGASSTHYHKTLHRHSIGGFALYTRTEKTGLPPAVKLATILKDHLGSTDLILTATWNSEAFANPETERQSFDPWGERRDPETFVRHRLADTDPFRTSATDSDRGYTGHEQLDDSGLIHMNGRIYDPELGRMLSPDPFVQVPEYSQNFNRYSYVLNNPLNKTDPSGYSWLSKAFDKIGNWFSENWRTVVTIVVAAVLVCTGIGAAIGGAMFASVYGAAGIVLTPAMYTAGVSAMTGAFVGTVTGALGAALAGGDIGDVLKGAVVGGISGALAGSLHGVGGTPAADAANIVGHGAIGGASNVAMGGKFQDGFLSAAASAATAVSGLTSPRTDLGKRLGFAGRTAIASAAGGTAAAIGGGKFANGAVTGAFHHVLNAEALSVKEKLLEIHKQEMEASCVCASMKNLLKVSAGVEVSEGDIRNYLNSKQDWNRTGFHLSSRKVTEALNYFARDTGVTFNRSVLTQSQWYKLGDMAARNIPYITSYRTPYNPNNPFVSGHAIVIHGLNNTGDLNTSYFTVYNPAASTARLMPASELQETLYVKTQVIWPSK